MNPPHALAVELASDALRAVFAAGWRVRVQLPLVLGLDTDPIPDITVVPGRARDYTASHPSTAALVVEISDTSLTVDTTVKAEDYATAGIADYWVIDLENHRLLVLRDPAPVAAGGVAYRTHLAFGPADTVAPLAAPTAAIPVADLLP